MLENHHQKRIALVKKYLKSTHIAPSLYRLNGSGFCFLGTMVDQSIMPYFFTMHWFTLLWLPIFPLGIYLVEVKNDEGYLILGKLKISTFHKIYKSDASTLYISVITQSLLRILAVALAVIVIGILRH